MHQVKHAGTRRSCARTVGIEDLEGRLMMAANAWKAAVSGSWNDATKWSLGHVPTVSEDVQITVAGNYTVTIPPNPLSPGYYQMNSFKFGGASGKQVLNVQGV